MEVENSNRRMVVLEDDEEKVENNNNIMVGEETLAMQRETDQQMLEMKIAQAMYTIQSQVPTLAHDVRQALRQRGQVVQYFGENPAQIRQRLTRLMAEQHVLQQQQQQQSTTDDTTTIITTSGTTTTSAITYTHASKELIQAREDMAQFSFQRAKLRLERERNEQRYYSHKNNNKMKQNQDNGSSISVSSEYDEVEEKVLNLYQQLKNLALQGSQYAGESRPLSTCCVYDDHKVATAGWNAQIQIYNADHKNWNVPMAQTTTPCHDDRIMSMAVHHTNSTSTSKTLLATASIDLTAKLWSVSPSSSSSNNSNHNNDTTGNHMQVDESKEEKDGTMTCSNHDNDSFSIQEVGHYNGHEARLCRIGFHPSGRYVATTSFDTTFRLWDVEYNRQNLLLQDSGHVRPTSGLSFHTDGSLIVVGDYASSLRAWDLRCGKVIDTSWGVSSHAGRILTVQCHPTNGRHIVTAGDDGTIQLWDLRYHQYKPTTKNNNKAATGALLSIPAHNRLIPQIRFHPTNGESLASCSFDGTVKLWSTRDWKCLNVLRAHEGKVMDVDFIHTTITNNNKKQQDNVGVVTCGFDKTLKLWK